MVHGRPDVEIIRETHNIDRYFTTQRAIAWVLLVCVIGWGAYGFVRMPRRKDPDIPVRVAMALTQWPGVSAEKVEQLVTRPIEERIAQNNRLHPATPGDFAIKSLSLPGLSIVQVQLDESVDDVRKEFSDINLKLNALNSQLPQGAGPIQFNSDFGETAALMLTVASPPETALGVALRAAEIQRAVEEARQSAPPGARAAFVVCYPQLVNPAIPLRGRDLLVQGLLAQRAVREARTLQGPGFLGFDVQTDLPDEALLAAVQAFAQQSFGAPTLYPDTWAPVIIRNPQDTEARLTAVAGPRYTYRQLDDATHLLQNALAQLPLTSSTSRSGVLPEQITLEYSQAKLAAYGLTPSNLGNALGARNITTSGGVLTAGGLNVAIDPSGEFDNERAIGNVLVAHDAKGNGVYLRDLVSVVRSYQSPATYLNYFSWKDAQGEWHRSPAITLSVQMRSGQQIADFGRDVDAALTRLAAQLPPDLILSRTSDQPRQVHENIDLFMEALYEAIALVVLVALIGFWEWRSATLIAISIPITLAITFGAAHALGVELQQVSIATLIIALGLLVDDPVVAGDSIKRELGAGQPPSIAAWLGPTKIGHAILFATITNIVAYLPFLILTGTTGEFLHSLPVVMTCALVSSRLVSMTFVPLLGYYLLRRPKHLDPPMEERRKHGFTGFYYRIGVKLLEHRWKSFAFSLLFLVLGAVALTQLPTSFFPDDVQYISIIDVWLPNNVSVAYSDQVSARAEGIVRRTAAEYASELAGSKGKPRELLKTVTTFVGGGGPRFWYSLNPEQRQNNYAQLIVEIDDKFETPALVERLRAALASELPGARADVRQLETNAVGVPVQLKLSSQNGDEAKTSAADLANLSRLGAQLATLVRKVPFTSNVRTDWGEESFDVKLEVDPDRANQAGVSNLDVANSASAGVSGKQVSVLREGDKQIPVVTRLRFEERANLEDVKALYVYPSDGTKSVPLGQVASVHQSLVQQRIRRQDHFRTLTVEAFPATGYFPSQVMKAIDADLKAFQKTLPPGYTLSVGGSAAKQSSGFAQLGLIMALSILGIFVALVIQFNSAVKPLLVFAAVPYGAVGALLALWVAGISFGFMAFLGIASLVGVIVSHVIVLFDYIEENHAHGEPLRDSLLDAGIARLRPVMITVLATLLGLVPLALHGGPLWQPLCYAQIGGLAFATFIELLLVKVFYAIFVLDLKIVKWDEKPAISAPASAATT
jgi:multidrug efflux pump subunit AcrB